MSNDLIICSAMFSFSNCYTQDFNSNQIFNAKEWLFSFAKSYFDEYESNYDGSQNLFLNFKNQFLYFQSKTDVFASLQKVIDDVTSTDPRTSKAYVQPKLVWGHYSDITRPLDTIALALISLPTSEACVERSFGQQGFVHRKLRNRMGEEQIGNEMLLRFNYHIKKTKSCK
jgi:hypothetical protein